ncbi:MAG: hypothetical protein H7Y03_09260 [Chitinophagaceae bacterium]|nr:hypothetical protein [Chitinophagaceae bacterium]
MKTKSTVFVLILEIIAICALHAVKINQAAPKPKNLANRMAAPYQRTEFVKQVGFNW